MADHNAATRLHQQASLLEAENHGLPWDAVEVELLQEGAEAVHTAALLGRTVYAVQSARHRIAKGEALGGGKERRSTPASRAMQAWASDDPRWG